MINQNNIILEELVSLNNNISYVITLDLVGEIVSQHYRDAHITNKASDKIISGFKRVVTAASLLNFDNVKFLMYEEDNIKNIIINFQETSLIIGLTDSSLSDVVGILAIFLGGKQY